MFAKIYQQIFDSSIAADYRVRHVFEDMLKLADISGVVDMTHDAIARRTNMPIEEIVYGINELMKPDPASRSGKANGARLAYIDSGRDWGWQIVNYGAYREMRDEDARRSYHRDYMRDWARKKRAEKKGRELNINNINIASAGRKQNGSVQPRTNAPCVETTTFNNGKSPSQNVEPKLSALKNIESSLTQEEEEEEEEVEEVPSTVSLPGRPESAAVSSVKSSQSIITDTVEAKQLICSKILDGKNPDRMWSPNAEDRLAKMCKEEGGIPIQEIDDIAWFKQFREKPLTETSLMIYWGDEARRASEMRKKLGVSKPAAKPEPPRWPEFFYWKHDENVVLPRSFYLLDPDQRAEYHRDFPTFVAAVPAAPDQANAA